jgi:hypothetical protein
MANRRQQGWSADPFGLHEERYFSAGRATKLVRDGTTESYDEPPSGTWDMPDDAPEAEGFAASPAGAQDRPAGEALPRAGVGGPYADGSGAVPKRSIARSLAAAATVIAITVVAGIVLVTQESRPAAAPNQAPTIPAAAFVIRSAGRSLAEGTADMTVNGTLKAQFGAYVVNGAGEVNFGTNAWALDATFITPSPPVSEQMVMVNGSFYIAESIDGASSKAGDWVQMPASEWVAENAVGSDPLSTLLVLEQPGGSVLALGARDLDGVSCTGYAVTPSKAAMIEAARTESARLGYSAAVTGQLVSQAEGTPPTITIWFDAQGLVREETENLSAPAGNQGGAVSGSIVMDFSNFGSPVRITAPTDATGT